MDKEEILLCKYCKIECTPYNCTVFKSREEFDDWILRKYISSFEGDIKKTWSFLEEILEAEGLPPM